MDQRLVDYAPIVRLGPGEVFGPIDSAAFMAKASLVREGQAAVLIQAGEVTDARLAAVQPSDDTYLELFPDAELPLHLQRALPGVLGKAARAGRRAVVRAASALGAKSVARLGQERLKEARNAFPFDPVQAAIHCCLREAGGYVVLQYWLFYAYNDWGSSHGGWNDHEGDWENIHVYLKDGQPVFVALSAHGKTTAHPWNEDLEKEGKHVIACVARGSHANYRPSETPAHREQRWWHDLPGTRLGPKWELIDLDSRAWLEPFKGRWGATFDYRLPGDRDALGVSGPESLATKRAYSDPIGWAGLSINP